MLAKLTSKNQLTLPKSVTETLGPVQYFEVQATAGQIILTPVRIQRGDAVRAKLAELAIDEKTLEQALNWSQPVKPARKSASKPSSAATAVAPAPAKARAPASKAPAAAARKTAPKTVAGRAAKPVQR